MKPSNVYLYDPQGGAAFMPVYTVNNTHYQNYIRGPNGTYDPALKYFSPLVTPQLNQQVKNCYIQTGNPQQCARNATKDVQSASRGYMNKYNVSYSTGASTGLNWDKQTCKCGHATLQTRPACNCSY